MKNNTKTPINYLPIAVVAILMIASSIYIYLQKNFIEAPILLDQKPQQKKQIDTSMVSKFDPTHSFTVLSAPDFMLTSSMTSVQKYSKGSYMDVCMLGNNPLYDVRDTVLCYVGNEKTDGFVGAAFVINATSSITQEECAKPELEGSKGQTISTVNGIIFYKNRLNDAGLGHYLNFDSYRTYRNNICYTLDLKVESNRGVMEKGLNADFSAMMLKKMETILSTFRFIN